MDLTERQASVLRAMRDAPPRGEPHPGAAGYLRPLWIGQGVSTILTQLEAKGLVETWAPPFPAFGGSGSGRVWRLTAAGIAWADQPVPMTREQAITEIRRAWSDLAGEFCMYQSEHEQNDQQCRDVLTALGVTADEIKKVGL